MPQATLPLLRRLLWIDRRLVSPDGVTAREIMDTWSVSDRTARRDLDALAAIQPLEWDQTGPSEPRVWWYRPTRGVRRGVFSRHVRIEVTP